MSEDSSNPNIEWKKKKGFDNKDRITRKVDVKKAIQQEATEKKPVSNIFKAKPTELPKGLRKIRRKIRETYEEDDEDDFILLPSDFNNSLMNALHEDEKRQLEQKQLQQDQNMLQQAGKAAALMTADKTAKSAGLKRLDKEIINRNMLDVTQSSYTFEQSLKEKISDKLKFSTKRLSDNELVNLLQGIKRVQQVSDAPETKQIKNLEGWNLNELVDAGKTSTKDKEIAEKILEKSGRKKGKKSNKKTPEENKMNSSSKNPDINVKKEYLRF